MRSSRNLLAVLVALSFAWTTSAHAGPTASVKCQASKLKASGKACDCRHGVAAKALANGDTPDFTKCATKLADAFGKAEGKGGCPATGEGTTVDGRLARCSAISRPRCKPGRQLAIAAIDCAAAKLKAAGKKCACVHKAQATATIKGTAPDFTKCDAKLEAPTPRRRRRPPGACPTVGDAEAICDTVEATLVEVEADVADRDTHDVRGARTVRRRLPHGHATSTARARRRPNGVYAGAPDRTLVTSIWYPTDADRGLANRSTRRSSSAAARVPLIIRAHGFSAFRNDSIYLVRHLASRGYIVVAPDFPLSNLNAPGGPTLVDIDEQARDVSFLIDRIIAENANASSFLFGKVDTDKIGAIGHSLGGATVLLATYHTTVRDPRIDATVALSPLGVRLPRQLLRHREHPAHDRGRHGRHDHALQQQPPAAVRLRERAEVSRHHGRRDAPRVRRPALLRRHRERRRRGRLQPLRRPRRPAARYDRSRPAARLPGRPGGRRRSRAARCASRSVPCRPRASCCTRGRIRSRKPRRWRSSTPSSSARCRRSA